MTKAKKSRFPLEPEHTINAREAIYLALHQIPPGRVITYGGLARIAGLPGAARLVGRCLKELPEGSQLPWHRVINAQGKISLPPGSPGFHQQLKYLEAEGIICSKSGRIDLTRYGF